MAPLSGSVEDTTSYSREVHKAISIVNVGIVGFLQLKNPGRTSSVFEANNPTILCFWILIFVYLLLRVSETRLIRTHLAHEFVGHFSHLFGALAAIVLFSLLCFTFSLLLLPFWFIWLSFVLYSLYKQIIFPEPEANQSASGSSDPSSPV